MGFKEKLKNIPDEPGVYIFKNKQGRILYVGKAISLRKRVRSYSYSSPQKSPKVRALIDKIEDIDHIITASETEALILESNLIKEHQPKYNISLRDDKNYPLLKITVKEDFPRLILTRKLDDDGALYFGRYTDAKALRRAVKFLRRVFPLSHCRSFPKKPCLDYHLLLCPGPCAGKITKAEYRDRVKELILFLKGKKKKLLKELSEKMDKASRDKKYEEALRLRDQIEALARAVSPKPGSGGKLAADLDRLARVLDLKKIPAVIETIDISNISGQEAVGVVVCFCSGRPDKSGYRKFKIKTVTGIDDYAMISEVIQRRYKASRDKQEEAGRNLPDLIVIDGGSGHVSTAVEVLAKINLSHIPVIGIAKAFEHIYLPERKVPLVLSADSRVLHLIMRMRDEAHRFAHKYHHTLRKKLTRKSELDLIPGIGKERKKELLRHFGKLVNIRHASIMQLKRVDYISQKTAEKIKEYFSKE